MDCAGACSPVPPTALAGTPTTVVWGWYIPEHNAAGADPGAFANRDIAEHLGTRRHQHAGPDFWMAVALLVAGAAKRYLLENGYIVVNH